MKRAFILFLTAAIVAGCVGFAGCAPTTNETDVETGLAFSIKSDDNNDRYAVVDEYLFSEADAEKITNGNYSDLMIDLVIPTTYERGGETYDVKEIASGAFSNNLVIKSVVVPDCVTTIGASCFAGCTNLTELTLPFVGEKVDSLNAAKTFGYLFGTAQVSGATAVTVSYNETGSTQYYIPNSLKKVTVTGAKLSPYAFYGMNLEEVVLSGSVTEIPSYAFYAMASLKSFTLPKTVAEINAYAFASCTGLINFDFNETSALTKIGKNAFYGCSLLGYSATTLKTITLPGSLVELGEAAFANCTSLLSVDLSAINLIQKESFYGCTNLEALTLQQNTQISFNAFNKCDKLKESNVANFGTATFVNGAFDSGFFNRV